jgi:hypothetical protein
VDGAVGVLHGPEVLQRLLGPAGGQFQQAERPVGEGPRGRQVPCARVGQHLSGELPGFLLPAAQGGQASQRAPEPAALDWGWSPARLATPTRRT